jgi:hypothetical protein
MRQEQTLPIPYVTLLQEDLAEMAARFEAIYQTVRSDFLREYDETTEQRRADWEGSHSVAEKARAEAYVAERAAEREKTAEDLTRWKMPEYSVATQFASFSDRDWGELWGRVSSHDVRKIRMRVRTNATSLTVDLDLTDRGRGYRRNTIEVDSEDAGVFDREIGWFSNRFLIRSAKSRETLTSGVLGFLLWIGVPALLVAGITVAIADALLSGGGGSLSARVGLLLSITLLAAFVFGWFAPDLVLSRIGPRVAIEGVGNYERAREYLTVVVLGMIASAAVAVAVAIVPALVSGTPG